MEKTFLGESLQVSRVGQGLGTGIEAIESDATGNQHRMAALTYGIQLGLTFLDTAESYGQGLSERLIGALDNNSKKDIQIATKFSPENSKYEDLIDAANASLLRLKCEVIHLYQVHWPNPAVSLEETLTAMLDLRRAGKVLEIGVCNFSKKQLENAVSFLGPNILVSNQVEYNLFDRHIEKSILPYCITNGIKIVAYSPLDRGRVFPTAKELRIIDSIALKYELTREQLSLSWLLRNKDVLAIPSSKSFSHLKENSECLKVALEHEDFDYLSSLKQEINYVLPKEINVSEFGEDNRRVYKTLQEAEANPFNLVPSPSDLADELRKGEEAKPVRVIPSQSKLESKPYDLIEGRSRYWAWVIAFGEDKPIPVYLRNSKEKEI